MKQYTVAVIGCGRIGFSWDFDPGRIKPASHLGAFSRNPRIRIVGAAEIDGRKRAAVSRAFPGLPVFADAKVLLQKTRPDIVVIATPDDTHYPMVKLAAEHRIKLILCEKPIADNLSDAGKAVKVSKKFGSILLVNHMRRFDPVLRKFALNVRSGKLGEIQLVRALYVNGLLNSGTHTVDLLRCCLGDIVWVSARKNPGAVFTHKNDYNADAVLFFKNGTRGVMQSLDARHYYLFEQQFYGTKKLAMLKNLSLTIEIVPAKKALAASVQPRLSYADLQQSGDSQRSFFKNMVDYVVRCLDGKEKPTSTGEDAYETLKVLMAVRQSAQNNGERVWI